MIFDNALVELIVSHCTEVDSGARNADVIIFNTVLSALSDAFLERMAENKPIKRVALSVKHGQLQCGDRRCKTTCDKEKSEQL